jgi:hypothetical protein
MNKYKYIVFMFLCFSAQAQDIFELVQLKKTPLNASVFLGVNMYDELFYVNNYILFKETATEKFSYQNNLYGSISNVDLTNSLKATLFFKDFNTVVQLDRWLGEINKINFAQSNVFSNVNYVTNSSNNRLWIFNGDTQQLQIYNPNQDIIEASTQPITEYVLDFYSNYNFCWVLTKTKLIQFNSYGNELNVYLINDFEAFTYSRNKFLFKKNNKLFVLNENSKVPKLLTLPKLTIKDFSVTNETLYIYDGKELSSFKIISKSD